MAQIVKPDILQPGRGANFAPVALQPVAMGFVAPAAKDMIIVRRS